MDECRICQTPNLLPQGQGCALVFISFVGNQGTLLQLAGIIFDAWHNFRSASSRTLVLIGFFGDQGTIRQLAIDFIGDQGTLF